MEPAALKWDRIYRSAAGAENAEAADVLSRNAFLLPASGRALDLACGLGGNAVFLARAGLRVTAWDISADAIAKLNAHARKHGLALEGEARNITPALLAKNAFDIIVVSRFLDRTLKNAIIAALKPQGLLFYQTFTQVKTDAAGPQNPEFLLVENELLRLFTELTVVFYRENGRCGDWRRGLRNEAQFIGQKTDGQRV